MDPSSSFRPGDPAPFPHAARPRERLKAQSQRAEGVSGGKGHGCDGGSGGGLMEELCVAQSEVARLTQQVRRSEKCAC
jgi:hypothetical protein